VDDEAGTDTEWVCEAKLDYDRDAAANVEMVRSETHCTVDKKPEPEIKQQIFRWQAEAQRFEEVKAGSR
jgi:2',3'-cyclic-nucleotide 2'-phosphodiesterase (5'-nucleotidase family)